MATEALPSVARRPAAGRLTGAVSGVARWAVLVGLALVFSSRGNALRALLRSRQR